MIPISLTLQGIYSYQEKQHIDFTNLCDAALFGIFGSVGSGKSTILEAISFALYGETERMNKKDNRNYNMMNLKSNSLLIDFIFKNNSDDKEYRFVVKGQRNSKRFDDVRTFERSALMKNNGEWIPLQQNSSTAENIIGLNYKNFKRTIIVPQGRFQEFLQLGSTERSNMMKELFQLHKFDFSDKTKRLEKENEAKIGNIEGQLKQLQDISEEKIKEITDNWNKLEIELHKNIVSQNELELKVDELNKLKELFDKIAVVEADFDTLNKQKPQFEQLKESLREFQNCRIKFKSKIENLDNDTKKLSTLEKELQSVRNLYENKSRLLQNAKAEFDIIKPKFDSKERLKNEVADFVNILKIKELQSKATLLQQRSEKGRGMLKETIDKCDVLQSQYDETKQTITSIKLEEIDMLLLLQIKEWFNGLENLQNNKKQIEKQITDTQSKKEELFNQLKAVVSQLELNVNEIDKQNINNHFLSKQSELENKKNAINIEKQKLISKQELIDYAENLHEGDECPVCGSVHHPKKMLAKDMTSHLSKLDESLQQIINKSKELNIYETQFNVNISKYEDITGVLDGLKTQHQKIIEELENHNDSYKFEKKYTITELEKEIERAGIQKKTLQDLDKKLNKIEKSLKTQNSNKEKYQAGINKINKELDTKTTQADTLLQQINLDDIDNYLTTDSDILEQQIIAKNKEYDNIVDRYKQVEKQIDTLMPEVAKLKGVIETKTMQLNDLTHAVNKARIDLDDEVQLSDYKAVADIKAILKQQFNVDEENKRISDFENRLFSANKQINELRKTVEGKNFDAGKFKELQTNLKEIKTNIAKQNKQLGFLEQEKKEQENKLAEKNLLKKDEKKLRLRKDNIETLKKLFKANGFVNYISRVYLQNLVKAANQRFSELTQQKLRLELNNSNEFIIRDYLNGGEQRSVKTLSGGQTFQASLSLALALTDNIQQLNNSNNNFFFLDEGFGSLDKTALQIVFQSIKSLRKENRIVGIISHVEDLQQEIDSYLKIVNNEKEGSQIIRSWD